VSTHDLLAVSAYWFEVAVYDSRGIVMQIAHPTDDAFPLRDIVNIALYRQVDVAHE
jgi:hypothetical protein